ncbi:single-stranded DNA-binding protein [Hephaestia caeni]|uniref:Single-stranded DNA-binding protein n=2 Tax=Hephaestia caeni TaxID=645617 RepID=A0A397P9J9_9SPHN|nr:single-stranded DNA-binding protein [Hephaestia caeni]
MIDFSRLGRETPEERAARDAERVQAEIAADTTRRNEWSKKTIIAQLTEDVELRSTHSGDHVATLRCSGPDGEFTASYWLPPHKPKACEVLSHYLREGATVVLKGYWKNREWNDRTGQRRATAEFQAQYVATAKEAG